MMGDRDMIDMKNKKDVSEKAELLYSMLHEHRDIKKIDEDFSNMNSAEFLMKYILHISRNSIVSSTCEMNNWSKMQAMKFWGIPFARKTEVWII